MPLPELRTKAKLINPKVLLIYSLPKLGKSTILSKLENCLIIDTEDGSDYLESGFISKVGNFDELLNLGKEIKEANFPYDYIALDTITELERWCEAAATGLYKKSPMASAKYTEQKDFNVLQLPKGAGYLWLRIAFHKWFDYIKTLAPHIILVAHVKETDFVIKAGYDDIGNPKLVELGKENVSSFSIDLQGKDKQIACSKADSICFMYKKFLEKIDNKEIEARYLNFKVSGEALAGTRPRHLDDREIMISKKNKNGEIEAFWNEIYRKDVEETT